MTIVTLQLPDDVFSAHRRSPEESAPELRGAAAIHWYEDVVFETPEGRHLGALSRFVRPPNPRSSYSDFV